MHKRGCSVECDSRSCSVSVCFRRRPWPVDGSALCHSSGVLRWGFQISGAAPALGPAECSGDFVSGASLCSRRAEPGVHGNPEIAPPTEWIFRAGIAYPMRAEIVGNGQGAERRCVFSTGAFVEPIEVWDEPRRLKLQSLAPMQEWTPYSHIEPPICMAF